MTVAGSRGRAGGGRSRPPAAPEQSQTSSRPRHQNPQSQAAVSLRGALSQMTQCPVPSKVTARAVGWLDMPIIHHVIHQQVY